MKMKNKKEVQDLRAQQVREERKAQKARKAARRESLALENIGRPELDKKNNPKILIVCEGENTEPSYFENFKLLSVDIDAVGEGYNTVSLVNRALVLKKKKKYDQVWCVFDKDDFSDFKFNAAIQKAEKQGFGVAYSNQSFEYWFILHFNDHQGGAMHRGQYNKLINSCINPFGVMYEGYDDKEVSSNFFELMMAIDEKNKPPLRRVDLAINRAKRNYDKLDHFNPAKEESSTTVFKLVEEILKYI